MNWALIAGEIWDHPLSLLINVLTSATTSGVFLWLGKRWIDDHFSKELEAFKAEKQVELAKLRTDYGRETERLKADLNRFADRATRFHLREYEVLPKAWGLMNKAYGAASNAISGLQEYPDLDKMGQADFTAWLEQSGLPQHERDKLASSTDKNQHYGRLRSWQQMSEANRAAADFTNYVILKGVFIDEPLSLKMMKAGTDIRIAMISRSMVERLRGQSHLPGQTNYWLQAVNEIKAIEPVVSEVKHEIRNRLSTIQLAPK